MTTSPAFLIQYGRPGFVGRFRSVLPLARGDRVVIRGPRGTEFGEILLPLAGTGDDGEVIRTPTPDDEAAAVASEVRGHKLLAVAAETAESAGLSLAFVDVEITADRVAILHALPWDACDATPVLEALAARFGLAVRLFDLSRQSTPAELPEPAEKGCGKPGCGTESGGCSTCGTEAGGGCSSGSCSRGSVKSADELTAYFADLRQKMEAAGMTRTPLN